eukprot:TRINITY_DN6689_c0_g1_i1.p1 TRINITY_DN6689_c0_g1~~TRINITY_DN6689_c0_g1_i1.p1  ORF type:complete len:197 (-),score=56.05 TRINITY_DN6689_c0_g1_i1:98-688(-)
MDNPKFFQAFLNGVVRNIFFGDESITAEFLKTEIFSADPVSVDELAELFDRCAAILKDAAKADAELTELESSLSSTSLNEMQQAVMLRVWRTQRPKIHDALTLKSKLNNSLKNLSWRVDVKTQTKAAAALKQELNEPVAIAEFIIGKVKPSVDGAEAAQQTADDTTLRVEMNRDQLTEVVNQINQIQSQIEKLTSQ